jgi:hypothetical protein
MTISPLKVPYLRAQRNFPNEDLKTLSVEMDRSYIDIADKVNTRTIGIFPANFSVVTGEKWYIEGSTQSQQTLRQIYPIDGEGPYPHGIDFAEFGGFTRIYGTFTDGTYWYPLPFVSVVNVTNQVNIYIDSTYIQVTEGAGSPTITSGFVILEWLALF